MKALYETYRPTTWNEVIGQDKAVSILQHLCKRGIAGRAVWLSGQSGQGKTTIAYITAREVADKDNIIELDASDLTPARLKELEHDSHYIAMGSKPGRAYIVNEAHGLRRDSIRQLLVMLERIPEHCIWIFTTTKDGQESLFEDQIDAHPLLSRTIPITLTSQGLADKFAERCKDIAVQESLDGRPIGEYLKLARKHKSNMRGMLQAIEAGLMLV